MFDDLVLKNRSCRGFDSSYKVSEEEIIQMLSCARLTASSMNLQTLKYHIGTDGREVKDVLGGIKFAGGLTDRNLPYEGQEPTAFILICHDLSLNKNADAFRIDVGIAAQTILLKATEMELGGCMMSAFNPEKIKEQLNLDEKLAPVLVIALGKPIENIVIKDIEEGEPHKYFRDEKNTHYVPKRKLKDIIF